MNMERKTGPGRPKVNENKTVVNTYIDTDLYFATKDLNRSELINRLLRGWFKSNENDKRTQA